MTRILLLAAACAELLGAGSVQRKFDAIQNGRLRPGAIVLFAPGEINSWANEEARILAPGAVRDLHLEFATARVTASAQVDFLKLRQSAAGLIARNLLGGERTVTAAVRVESRAGKARVHVERVEVSGVPIEGPALDFLIRACAPEATIDEWFDLDRRIQRIAVTSRGVSVFIGGD